MRVKSFIFDLDGTLVDAFPAHVESFRQAFTEAGHPFDEALVALYYGEKGVEIIRQMLNKPKIDDECQQLMRRKTEIFQHVAIGNVKLLPGVVHLLESLEKRGITVALATSAVRAGAELCLKVAGIDSYFKIIITGDDINNGKPDPEVFLKAAKILKTDPKSCAVVEDSLHGVKAAKAAKMKSIAVTTGTTSRSDLETLKPDILIDSLEDLATNLDTFLARL